MLQHGGEAAKDADNIEEYAENSAYGALCLDIGHSLLLFLNGSGVVDIADLDQCNNAGDRAQKQRDYSPCDKPACRIPRNGRLIIWRGSALLGSAIGAVARTVGQRRSAINTIAHYSL